MTEPDLDIQNLRNRSRLTDEQQWSIVQLIDNDPTISMKVVAERLALPYPSVRMAFQYLGHSCRKAATSRQDRQVEWLVLPLLEKGKSFKEIEEATGFSKLKIENAARRLGKKELVKKIRQPRHGTATEYMHHGCRCMPCKQANAKRLKDAYEDRRRRAATDAPHGTETAYRNWGCRCAPCCEVGAKANKDRMTVVGLETPKAHVVWSKEEDEAILSYELTAKELAVKLGRGVAAVNGRRSGMWIGREPASVLSS